MSRPPRASWAAGVFAGAVALAAAFPPEVHPESGVAVALLLALATALGAWRAGTPLVAGTALAAAFNVAVSLAPGRTAGALAALALPLAAAAVAAALPRDARRLTAWALCSVGAALGVLAVLQRAFLLRIAAEAARAEGAAPDAIARLASGRPFGTHALPASLAGLLVLALAAAGLLLAERPASRVVRAGAVALAALAGAGLLATGSLGGVVGLAAGALFLAAPRVRARGAVRIAAAVVAGLVVVGGAVALLRGGADLAPSARDNPLRLRAANWRGAALVGLDRPACGIGFGAFGALYPHVRRPGDVETVYAHNSWLQLAVEGGLPAAVALAAGAWVFARRARGLVAGDPARWAAAGACAFAAHNLFDFTAYLPGVAVAAGALAGFCLARPGAGPSGGGTPSRPTERRAAGLAVALLAVVAALWGSEAVARRALERAAEAPGAAVAAGRAALRAAPQDPVVGVAALRAMLGGGAPPDELAPEAERLVRLDGASPAPWHVAGDIEARRGRLAAAWQDWSMASLRHPADRALRDKVAQAEQALAAAGLGARPLAYGGAVARPTEMAWEAWDALLTLLGLVLAGIVVHRWRRPGAAPAAAIALAFALLLSIWGHGGALPGVRFGREALIAVALLAALWPPRGEPGEPGVAPLPAEGLLLFVPLLAWAAVAARLAPDPAGARDGLCAFAAIVVVLLLSWRLARENDSWPHVALGVFVAGAWLSALLWAVQKSAALLGIDLSRAEVPLRADALRPAADFLHPGHFGTFLVAAALGVVGFALGLPPRWRLHATVGGGVLAFVGLSSLARGSIVALLAGGALLALVTADRRVRRLLAAGLAGAAALAGLVVAARLRTDPFAWSRLGIWRAGLRALGDRPLAGFGPGGFEAVAPAYAFRDPEGAAAYGKAFAGPHSDLLAAFLGLGVVGALGLLVALGVVAWRAARAVRAGGPAWNVHAGALAAVTALAAHAVVDDFLTERPVAAFAGALLLGAVAGRFRAERAESPWTRGTRVAATTALATAFLAGSALPYAADFAARAGAPLAAARLDPARHRYWIEAARLASGPPLPRLATALDRTWQALDDAPGVGETWLERARVLDAACRGPLAEEVTCGEARAAWARAAAAAPRNPFPLRARARLAAALGDTAAAEEDLRAALALEPEYLGARLDLARLLAERGDPGAGRRELGEVEARARRWAERRGSPYEAALLALDEGELDAARARLQ